MSFSEIKAFTKKLLTWRVFISEDIEKLHNGEQEEVFVGVNGGLLGNCRGALALYLSMHSHSLLLVVFAIRVSIALNNLSCAGALTNFLNGSNKSPLIGETSCVTKKPALHIDNSRSFLY